MTEPVPTERPTGVPLKFIPADTRGDMVLRKGVKIQGAAEILVSVFTRARGEKAARGVVIEAYDPATCYTSTLHVEASELVRQVGGAARLSLLDDASVRGTVEALLYRLILQPSAIGGLKLHLDAGVLPNLFRPEEEKGSLLSEVDRRL